MTDTTRTVLVAGLVALTVLTGAALASPASTTTTTDEQANETASVSMPDQKLDGDNVTIDDASLPDGGFVVVYNQSGAAIGHTGYLDAGDHENLSVSLNATVETAQVLIVSPVRNNGSESYNASADTMVYQTENGADVTDTSYVYFQERGEATTTDDGSEETTARDTSFATTEESTTAADTTTEETTTDDSSGSVPGFTPISGVVALVAATLVGLRRS